MSALPTELEYRLLVSVETITPNDAASFLEHMNNPRRLRPGKVSHYAKDMAAGRWEVGTSAIKFDRAGMLRDGQHRLWACIEADAPFRTVVYRNVTDAAVDNTDRGMVRQWADVLNGRGVANTHALQSACTLGWRWDRSAVFDPLSPTIGELEDWLAAHPHTHDAVRDGLRIRSHIGGRVSIYGSFLTRAATIDFDAADRFVEALSSGANLAPDDAVHRLRDRLLANAHFAVKSRGNQGVELAIVCKAWNAWITGKPVRQLAFRRGASMRESFPDLVDGEGRTYPFPDVERRRATSD